MSTAVDKCTELDNIVKSLQSGRRLTRNIKTSGYDLVMAIDKLLQQDPAILDAAAKRLYDKLRTDAVELLAGSPIETVKEDKVRQKMTAQRNNLKFLLRQQHESLNQWSKNELADQIQRELEILKKLDLHAQSVEELSAEFLAQCSIEDIVNEANHRILQIKGRCESFKVPFAIKLFNGGVHEWLGFKDSFLTQLSRLELTEPEKLIYLKSLMGEDPSRILSNITTTTTDPFKKAWDLLELKYDDKKFIIFEAYKRMIEYPKASSDRSLKQLYQDFHAEHEILRSQNIDLEAMSTILVYIYLSKFDNTSRKEFETNRVDARKVPSIEEAFSYTLKRINAVIAATGATPSRPSKANTAKIEKSAILTCVACKPGGHTLFRCKAFLALTVEKRNKLVRDKGLCINCLRPGHRPNECQSKFNCKNCDKRHNTLLHFDNSNNKKNNYGNLERKTILPTALVTVLNPQTGKTTTVKALIDQGSEATLINSRVCNSLGLHITGETIKVTGLGGASKHSLGVANFVLVPKYKKHSPIKSEGIILSSLVTVEPSSQASKLFNDLSLADPIGKGGEVELLIGADLIPEIILSGIIKRDGLLAQQTVLGYIISGLHDHTKRALTVQWDTIPALEQRLNALFQEEEPDHDKEDLENYFIQTTTRLSTGRYQVSLPFIIEPPPLGDSRAQAVKRLQQLELRLKKNSLLHEQYAQFINEYLDLGHMQLIEPSKAKYILPHHAVFKEDSTTTKVRVVFDGSAKTSNSRSLNCTLHNGPTLQSELVQVLMRFRLYKYTITADLEKMFRQIMIAPEHRPYQCILWANKTYQLNTVTYGTRPATYLAVRTLLQLASDEKLAHPQAQNWILKNFYVDDFLVSVPTLKQGQALATEARIFFEKGGFNLCKFASNNFQILNNIEDRNREKVKKIGDSEVTKALGLVYLHKSDLLSFIFSELPLNGILTKRIVLSRIASIFDPLGLLLPILTTMRLIVQGYWLEGRTWDEELPLEATREYHTLASQMETLKRIDYPRWLGVTAGDPVVLYGFADASEKAMAACVYLKTRDSIKLVAAKGKLAPARKKQSLPRLELGAALLLTNLTKTIITTLELEYTQVVLFSDSEITLAWINSDPLRWQTYVRNRVTKVQSLKAEWRHIPSEHNPADCASRGIMPLELSQHKLWWHGPEWILRPVDQWPKTKLYTTAEETVKKKIVLVISENALFVNNLLKRFSSWTLAKRTLGRILRWRLPKNERSSYLTPEELERSEKIFIKAAQAEIYFKEINCLDDKQLLKKSDLLSLSPFTDSDGLLRVGGRLENAPISESQRHPLIIPKGKLCELLIQSTHLNCLHSSHGMTLAYLRRKYWIVKGKQQVKAVLNKCIKCCEIKAATSSQLMGQLPSSRISPSRPFENTGVDYAGPITVKFSPGRGTKTTKGYIALFVCMATKAIHLETVSDLTAATFVAALKRMAARRGQPSHIFSDNGTNFVRANKELHEALELRKASCSPQSKEWLLNNNIKWHFIPPHSPHMGGLWEAGVKSMKYHIKRSVNNIPLTYEQWTTLLCQVEACLNSRPLMPLSEDPNDLNFLTPGHFLIGEALVTPPEQSMEKEKIEGLRLWKKIEKIHQSFWKAWQADCVTLLQNRPKWKLPGNPLKPGDLVIIKEDNLVNTDWLLGRITSVFPGQDGVVRVAEVKTRGGVILKRPIVKLARLPVESAESSAPCLESQNSVRVNIIIISSPELEDYMAEFSHVFNNDESNHDDEVTDYADEEDSYLSKDPYWGPTYLNHMEEKQEYDRPQQLPLWPARSSLSRLHANQPSTSSATVPLAQAASSTQENSSNSSLNLSNESIPISSNVSDIWPPYRNPLENLPDPHLPQLDYRPDYWSFSTGLGTSTGTPESQRRRLSDDSLELESMTEWDYESFTDFDWKVHFGYRRFANGAPADPNKWPIVPRTASEESEIARGLPPRWEQDRDLEAQVKPKRSKGLSFLQGCFCIFISCLAIMSTTAYANPAVIVHNGLILVKGYNQCDFILGDEVITWNPTLEKVPGLWFGSIRYNCDGFLGSLESTAKCYNEEFNWINETIEGCEYTITKYLMGFILGLAITAIALLARTIFPTCNKAKSKVRANSGMFFRWSEISFLRRVSGRASKPKAQEPGSLMRPYHFNSVLDEHGAVTLLPMVPLTEFSFPSSSLQSSTSFQTALTVETHDLRENSHDQVTDESINDHSCEYDTPIPHRHPTASDFDYDIPIPSICTPHSASSALKYFVLLTCIVTAIAGDATLYISSQGKVCEDNKCHKLHTTLTTLAPGSTIQFIDHNQERLTLSLKALRLAEYYNLVYLTSDFNVIAVSIDECRGSSDTCWDGSCKADSQLKKEELDLMLNHADKLHDYGCVFDHMRCKRSHCFHNIMCIHYKYTVHEMGPLAYVYRRTHSQWEARLELVYGNNTKSYVVDAANPTATLRPKDWYADLPLIITSAIHPEVDTSSFVMKYKRQHYYIDAAQPGYPQAGHIGDYQLGVNNHTKLFDSSRMVCKAYDCTVHCKPWQPAINRFEALRATQKNPFKTEESGDVIKITQPLEGSIGVMLTSNEIKNLDYSPASCAIQVANTYGCRACGEQSYITLISNDVTIPGLMSFTSNCSFTVDYVACQGESFQIHLREINNACELYFPVTNQTLVVTIDIIFKGDYPPYVRQQQNSRSIYHLLDSSESLFTAGITALSTLLGVAVHRFLRRLLCCGT